MRHGPLSMPFLSVFDLDRTLLSVNSSFAFGQYLYHHKVISTPKMVCLASTYLAHKAGLLNLKQLHESIFRQFFLGKPLSLIERHLGPFLASLEQSFYAPALEALRLAQSQGRKTALLSSTCQFLVEPIADRLGFDLWASTVYNVDKDRRFCNISQFMGGEEKALYTQELMEKWSMPQSHLMAFSDSHLDLPLLCLAGIAIAVNPTRPLRQICRQKGWQILGKPE